MESAPNPFNPSTCITYQLATAEVVALSIWNVAGQRIRSLVRTRQPAGVHTVIWDGRDAQGKPVATGVYLCQIRAGTYRAVRKMALIR